MFTIGSNLDNTYDNIQTTTTSTIIQLIILMNKKQKRCLIPMKQIHYTRRFIIIDINNNNNTIYKARIIINNNNYKRKILNNNNHKIIIRNQCPSKTKQRPLAPEYYNYHNGKGDKAPLGRKLTGEYSRRTPNRLFQKIWQSPKCTNISQNQLWNSNHRQWTNNNIIIISSSNNIINNIEWT